MFADMCLKAALKAVRYRLSVEQTDVLAAAVLHRPNELFQQLIGMIVDTPNVATCMEEERMGKFAPLGVPAVNADTEEIPF